MVGAVASAPASLSPIEAAVAGIEAGGAQLPDVATARQRQAIISAHPELQERELIKFASLSTAIAETLRERGLDEPAASLTAEVALAVFRTAFERWVDEANRRSFPELVRDSLDQLRAVTA